jgi:hypothetical protein
MGNVNIVSGSAGACHGEGGRFAPTITELQAAGATSLRAIAAGLNKRGIPTAHGQGEWTSAQVMRVLDQLPA